MENKADNEDTAQTTALPGPVSSKHSTFAAQNDGSNQSSLDYFKNYMMTSVHPEWSTVPLVAYCFMTGYIDSVVFSAAFVWPGFQTGNSVQLALALARLFSGPPGQRDTSFHVPDRQALTSLITFILGAFIGRIGDRMGPRTRLWLFMGTMIQALFTMSAAICIWQSGQGSVAETRGDPAWTAPITYVAIGFVSASLGLQGIIGKRVNGQFATTIVLTTIWCELMADPKLFNFRHWVITRDHKLAAVFAVFLGGFVGRALIDKIGSAGTLGVGCGIRTLIAIGWIFITEKKTSAKPGANRS